MAPSQPETDDAWTEGDKVTRHTTDKQGDPLVQTAIVDAVAETGDFIVLRDTPHATQSLYSREEWEESDWMDAAEDDRYLGDVPQEDDEPELRGGYEPGQRVEHEEHGEGVVRAHPDGEHRETEARAYVYFEDTPETTLRRVWVSKLSPVARTDGGQDVEEKRESAVLTDDGRVLPPTLRTVGDVPDDLREAVEAALDEEPNTTTGPVLREHDGRCEAVLAASFNEMPVSTGPGVEDVEWVAPYRAQERVLAALRDTLPEGWAVEVKNRSALEFYREGELVTDGGQDVELADVDDAQRTWTGETAYSEEFEAVVTVKNVYSPTDEERERGVIPIDVLVPGVGVETTTLDTVRGNAVEGVNFTDLHADPWEARELLTVLEAGIAAVEERNDPRLADGEAEYARLVRKAVYDQHNRIDNSLTTRGAGQ